jgi:hypothetical protein
MSPWAITDDELIWMVVSAAVVATGVLAWAGTYGYPSARIRVDGQLVLVRSAKFVELERDRVLASAKGIAATASGFVVTLVTGYLKDGITATVSLWSLVGCIVGAAGCIWLAASTSGSTRAFVRDL